VVEQAPAGNAPASAKAAPEAAARPDIEPDAPAPAVPLAAPMVDPRAGRRALRVLVVDDEPDIRTVVSATLRKLEVPVEVAEAVDGLDALEKIKAATPDLVVLDVMMPRMDGFDTCRALRENVRTAFVPILMLTASADQDSRTKGYLIGTDDYMSKPFMPLDLKMRIGRLLRRTYGI
jgi:DNA-binding response OmpR family regulator